MMGFFKHKSKSPVDVVRVTRDLLLSLDTALLAATKDSKKEEKLNELFRSIREIKLTLYGNSSSEPVPDACAQITQDIFQLDVFKLMIVCLPSLDLEVRKDVTQIVANLQRQQVHSRVVACDYLEQNKDLLDILVTGYENPDVALHYGAMLRECIRHQSIARHVLESANLWKFFLYIELQDFALASDATASFRELLTRHKSTVADFLAKNYDSFFQEYNSKLLESPNYITRRQGVKLLADILLDRSNSSVMMRYVCSKDNLRIMMNLLRESSKSIQVEAFHVFKLFVANGNKPLDIVTILVANRSKLLRFFSDFTTDKDDQKLDQDKAQVIKEIVSLEPRD